MMECLVQNTITMSTGATINLVYPLANGSLWLRRSLF
jgi:hypothetical protein